jgi:dinuclear metal center YbgI/SA1388 family protein
MLPDSASSGATLSDITSFLYELLEPHKFRDSAFNGLQIESPQEVISKVGFAVDSGLSVIRRAADLSCQLLIVHHGLLWGQAEPITGSFARKVALCMTHGLSIYGAHLPLDGHLVYGNSAQLARELELTDITPAFYDWGQSIGVSGIVTKPLTLSELAAHLATFDGALKEPLVLPFGKQEVRSIGIVTGSGTSCISECAKLGLDVLITGEAKQHAYHLAKEEGCSVICMGHYGSETFGVRALARVLKERFGVEIAWIDEPTGI